MKTKYLDLIDQTFDFPQEEFTLNNNELNFHGIDLMKPQKDRLLVWKWQKSWA